MKTNQEILQAIQAALPALEVQIKVTSGVEVKLQAEIEDGRRETYIRVSSEDLMDQMGPLARTVFKKFNIYFWGGSLPRPDQEMESIFFSPKVSYSHPSGGSNGTDFVWNRIWFNLETESWVYGETYK